jgi:hypothetical protein
MIVKMKRVLRGWVLATPRTALQTALRQPQLVLPNCVYTYPRNQLIENQEYWNDLWNGKVPPSVSMDEYMAYSTGNEQAQNGLNTPVGPIQLRNVRQNATFNGTMGRTSPSATIDEIVTYSSTGYDYFNNVSTGSVSLNANGQPNSVTASLNGCPGTTLARPASALGDHSESIRFRVSASGGAQGDANHGREVRENHNPRRISRHVEHRLSRITPAEREAF